MKQIFVMLMLLCFTLVSYAQPESIIGRSTSIALPALTLLPGNSAQADSEDYGNPIVLLLLIVFLILIILFLVATLIFAGLGLGLLVAAAAALVIWGLIAFGLLSSSGVTALHQNAMATGFKKFMIATSAAGGLLICGTGLWMLNHIHHWFSGPLAILTGMGCGALTGAASGFCTYHALRRAAKYFKVKVG